MTNALLGLVVLVLLAIYGKLERSFARMTGSLERLASAVESVTIKIEDEPAEDWRGGVDD